MPSKWDVEISEISTQAAMALGVTIGDDVSLCRDESGTWINRNGGNALIDGQPWMDDLERKLYHMAMGVYAGFPPAGMSFPALCGKYVRVIQPGGVSMIVHVKRYEV